MGWRAAFSAALALALGLAFQGCRGDPCEEVQGKQVCCRQFRGWFESGNGVAMLVGESHWYSLSTPLVELGVHPAQACCAPGDICAGRSCDDWEERRTCLRNLNAVEKVTNATTANVMQTFAQPTVEKPKPPAVGGRRVEGLGGREAQLRAAQGRAAR